MNQISKTHRGCTYFASSEEALNKTIQEAEFQRSIFYRSSVYSYSCFARLLNDNSVEFTESFNNGERCKTSNFKSKDDFWNSKG
jgi:hypothetical protein